MIHPGESRVLRDGTYDVWTKLLEIEKLGYRFHIQGTIETKQFNGLLTIFFNNEIYHLGYDYYPMDLEDLEYETPQLKQLVTLHQELLANT